MNRDRGQSHSGSIVATLMRLAGLTPFSPYNQGNEMTQRDERQDTEGPMDTQVQVAAPTLAYASRNDDALRALRSRVPWLSFFIVVLAIAGWCSLLYGVGVIANEGITAYVFRGYAYRYQGVDLKMFAVGGLFVLGALICFGLENVLRVLRGLVLSLREGAEDWREPRTALTAPSPHPIR